MKRNSKTSAEFGYGELENRKLLAADLGIAPEFSLLHAETELVSSVEAAQTATSRSARNQGSESSNEYAANEEAQQSDVALGWNALFGDILVENVENQNPGYASRSMAMLNVAIYDAVTLANGNAENTFYDYANEFTSTNLRVNAELAASQAAHTVLSALYPDQQASIDAFFQQTMERFSRSHETANSLALGSEIANSILDARANDGSDAIVDYTYSEGIGSFQADPLNPDVPVWGPGWGSVETFAISSAESFLPETTPAISSEQYATSYNEVKELGAVDSMTRTADQTEAGIFWAYDREGLGTPLALFGDVLEAVAIQEGNTFEENVALFAQASVAMADAGIVAWQTKFSEEFWRPVTAIHEGDNDGNSLTSGDTGWTALGAPDGGDDIVGFTPQFPTYVSGHATFGGALFGALQDFYGTDDISFELASSELEILMENPDLEAEYGLELDGATRSFDSFSQAMAENGRSRVYLGIHFDFDDLVGQEVGQAVASAVSTEFVIAQDSDHRGGKDHGRKDGRNDGPRDGHQDRERSRRGNDIASRPSRHASMGHRILPAFSDRGDSDASENEGAEQRRRTNLQPTVENELSRFEERTASDQKGERDPQRIAHDDLNVNNRERTTPTDVTDDAFADFNQFDSPDLPTESAVERRNNRRR